MDARRLETVYREYVIAPGLERDPVLRALASRISGAPSVLYPGCFVHVTPSFYFQHVVYVDWNEVAADFFRPMDPVIAAINARRRYTQRPYVRFIEADYTAPLPLADASFDVLLALSSGHVARGCSRYLRPGGILLADDKLGDARRAARVPELELEAVIDERRGKVWIAEDDLAGYLAPTPTPPPPGARPAGRRRARTADFYLFRRKDERPRRRRAGPA